MKTNSMKDISLISAIISWNFKEVIHLKLKNGYDSYDLIADIARNLYLEFRDVIEAKAPDWTEIYNKYGAENFEDLVFRWTEVTLAQRYDITFERSRERTNSNQT